MCGGCGGVVGVGVVRVVVWLTVVCGNFDISLDYREMGGSEMCGGCGVVGVGVVRVVVWWTVVCGNFDISLDHFARAIPPYTAPARAV